MHHTDDKEVDGVAVAARCGEEGPLTMRGGGGLEEESGDALKWQEQWEIANIVDFAMLADGEDDEDEVVRDATTGSATALDHFVDGCDVPPASTTALGLPADGSDLPEEGDVTDSGSDGNEVGPAGDGAMATPSIPPMQQSTHFPIFRQEFARIGQLPATTATVRRLGFHPVWITYLQGFDIFLRQKTLYCKCLTVRYDTVSK